MSGKNQSLTIHDQCAVCMQESILTSARPIPVAYMSVVESQICMKNTASEILPHSLSSTAFFLIYVLHAFRYVSDV